MGGYTACQIYTFYGLNSHLRLGWKILKSLSRNFLLIILKTTTIHARKCVSNFQKPINFQIFLGDNAPDPCAFNAQIIRVLIKSSYQPITTTCTTPSPSVEPAFRLSWFLGTAKAQLRHSCPLQNPQLFMEKVLF